MRVEYHPAIERELREIANYYNECSPGLGAEFLNEFEQHVLRITSMPKRWMIVESDIRQSLMKRFPYVIYYRILKNIVRITVVKRQRRRPYSL